MKGRQKLARVLDNIKSPIVKDGISIIAPCRGGMREPPPIANINPADPILASFPNPLSAIP
tara:strand:- start:214 stop:396 length:183 start_codon:yes stop_codon:yes gene_type:complete